MCETSQRVPVLCLSIVLILDTLTLDYSGICGLLLGKNYGDERCRAYHI